MTIILAYKIFEAPADATEKTDKEDDTGPVMQIFLIISEGLYTSQSSGIKFHQKIDFVER